MRQQSCKDGGCNQAGAAAAARLVRAALALAAMGWTAGSGISPAAAQQQAAQQQAAEVAYVEAVAGRVVGFSRGAPVLVDALDAITDGARLDLQPNSELRLCHYRTQKLIKLDGPGRASVSAAGVTAENGKAAGTAVGTCAPPTASTFQGGIVARSLGSSAPAAPSQPQSRSRK